RCAGGRRRIRSPVRPDRFLRLACAQNKPFRLGTAVVALFRVSPIPPPDDVFERHSLNPAHGLPYNRVPALRKILGGGVIQRPGEQPTVATLPLSRKAVVAWTVWL